LKKPDQNGYHEATKDEFKLNKTGQVPVAICKKLMKVWLNSDLLTSATGTPT